MYTVKQGHAGRQHALQCGNSARTVETDHDQEDYSDEDGRHIAATIGENAWIR